MLAMNPSDFSWEVASVASPLRPLPLSTLTVMSPGASGAAAEYAALVDVAAGGGATPCHSSTTACVWDLIGSSTSPPPTVAGTLGIVNAGVVSGLKFL